MAHRERITKVNSQNSKRIKLPLIVKKVLLCIKERRLPSSLDTIYRKLSENIQCKILFRRIRKTPPLKCNPSSEVALHTVLCSKHLDMFLLAIKSFLRFYSEISVVVHDDGTLRDKDIRVLGKHIKNLRIIDRATADSLVERQIDPYMQSRRKENVFVLKLIDIPILSRAKKIILMDSDIVFTRMPEDIINWIKGNDWQSFYNAEIPAVSFIADADAIERKHNIRVLRDFNAGFMGFKNDLGIDEIRDSLQMVHTYLVKPEGILSEEQSAYTILLSKRSAKPLNKRQYLVFFGEYYSDQVKMIHFISWARFQGGVYSKVAQKVINELGT